MANLGTFIYGTQGDDQRIGTYLGAEYFIADAGSDTYDGASPIIGGPFGHDRSAYDVISYINSPGGVHIDLQAGIGKDGWGGTDTLINISYVWGSMFDDVLIGDDQKNWISGLRGNDTIDGGPDSDFGYVVAYMDDPAGVMVDLTEGIGIDGWGGRDTIRNMTSIHGSDYNDVLIGNDNGNDFWGRAGADTFDGRGGFDTARYWDSGRLLDPANAATAGGRTGVLVDLAGGYALDEWGARDTLISIEWVDLGSGNDTVVGDDQNNIIFVRGGVDWIDGAGGVDRVSYLRHEGGATSASHSISKSGPESFTVANSMGTETLLGVERLQFSDGTMALSPYDAAGQALRLYVAALDRAPDAPGLDFHVNRLDNGVSLKDVASGFTNSPEFESKYGALSSPAFVDLLYQNVLDRGADSAGLAYHVSRLEAGISREDVLIGFSESPENITNTASLTDAGIWFV